MKKYLCAYAKVFNNLTYTFVLDILISKSVRIEMYHLVILMKYCLKKKLDQISHTYQQLPGIILSCFIVMSDTQNFKRYYLLNYRPSITPRTKCVALLCPHFEKRGYIALHLSVRRSVGP
jgi:hypothetical protein